MAEPLSDCARCAAHGQTRAVLTASGWLHATASTNSLLHHSLRMWLNAGRLADMASQMGVSQATGPLGDLSKGVSSMASMLGSQV